MHHGRRPQTVHLEGCGPAGQAANVRARMNASRSTTEGGREFARRRDIGISVQDVTDLVRIFFVDAGEGEFGKSFRRGRIKTIDRWWRRIFSRNCGKRDKQQNR